MCGIYGLISTRRPFPEERISELLAHRGPDDVGYWHEGPVHLGHRRLSILDLSEDGHQPMVTRGGRYVLTYNGEIYNHLDLRRELEAMGVSFASTCDSEVLLEGWAAWGRGVLGRLRGMFAFAVWDREEQVLTLARDATGIKPLYFYPLGPDEFAFASELKAFAAYPSALFAIDEDAVREYLGAGFLWRGDRTSIRGVRKLPAGHYLEVRGGAAGAPTPWWRPPTPRAVRARRSTTRGGVDGELDRQADALHQILDGVVAEHLQADVPVGLLLSGGLDSSVLAAIAARHAPGGVLRTLTLGFEPYAHDERVHARAVAEWIGSEHHELVMRPADALRELLDQIEHVDDLFGDSGVVPAFSAFRFCRERGLKVVLVGEGADEVFGGYPRFRQLAEDGGPRRALRFYRAYTRRRYGRDVPAFAELVRALDARAGGDLFHAVRLFETLVQLPSSLNMKVDHASMASSVEGRVPYQDRRVVEFLFRLPRRFFLGPEQGKLLLRHMAKRHRLVPESILERRKMGTPIPWGWLREGELASRAAELLFAPDSWTRRLGLDPAARAFFDGSEWRLPRSLRRRLGPYANSGWLVMNLLVLEAWARSDLFPKLGASPRSLGLVQEGPAGR